jgi:hypothetical protein
METLEKIKELTELLSVDATKFYKGNKSAGTRARKSAQELKARYFKNSEVKFLNTTRQKMRMHNIDTIYFFIFVFTILVSLKNVTKFIGALLQKNQNHWFIVTGNLYS